MTPRAVVCLVMAVATPAVAVADDAAAAAAAFARAKKLAKAGKWEQACPIYEDSYRDDPQLGALLNVADCHERIGRTATAWAEFGEAAEQARRKRDPRERYAKDRAEALKPRLVTFKIDPPSHPAPGLVVRRGELEITNLLGEAVLIDPGRYEVVVSAPGFRDWKTIAEIRDRDTAITIPRLERLQLEQPPPTTSALTTGAQRPEGGTFAARSMDSEDTGSARRNIGFGVAIAGTVALGAGAWFGIKAIGHRSDAHENCEANVCGAAGTAAIESAKSAMLKADLGFGIGLAAGITSIVLLMTAPAGHDDDDGDGDEDDDERHVQIVPTSYGAAITGTF